ncbi:MAG TPA: DUF6599 family protein, partial [Terriglobia bacterium]|nr:DUF6599 family protein [Terriglobia bacterium]
MSRNFVTSTVVFACLVAGVAGPGEHFAAVPQEKRPVVTLVPAPDWLLTSSQAADAGALRAWGGDAAIEQEYRVTAYTERSYRLEDHTAQALLEQAPDASSAYGLLTFYRTENMKALDGVPESVMGAGKALLARGPVFIRVSVNRPDAMPESDWRKLLAAVGGPPPSPRALELLPQALPARGRVRGSEKYLLGPVAAHRVLPAFPPNLLGFDKGAEVQTARYTAGRAGTLTLGAIDYPTPQIARAAFESINGALAKYPAGREPPFECRRQDAYVLVVLNAPSRAAAAHFLDGFKVAKEFNEDQASSGPSDVWQLVQLLIANGV